MRSLLSAILLLCYGLSRGWNGSVNLPYHRALDGGTRESRMQLQLPRGGGL